MKKSIYPKNLFYWKCNVSYFASKSAIGGKVLADLIKKNINVLESIGLNVRSVTADQGSSNRSAFKTLGSTIEHPYFIHNDKFVYLLYDACNFSIQ